MRIKSNDLERIAEALDISPTMHKYAIEQYDLISNYLVTQGINADFYPQGSMSTGTVVRPIRENLERDFDLDVVCQLNLDKGKTTGFYVKNCVGDALKLRREYREKLQDEDSRCWVLQYPNIYKGIGFSMDIVPSVDEDGYRKFALIKKGVFPEYALNAIAITEKATNGYRWISSNPKGFSMWFEYINAPFLKFGIEEKKRKILDENKALFHADAKIEDVPDYLVKSNLQRVIQILKRHRDLFYSRIKNGKELRVASVIITYLAARVAKGNNPTLSIEELLKIVVSGLRDYASLLQGNLPTQRFDGEVRDYIRKEGGKWVILNPVDPDDNYADSWTDDTAKAFFNWINAVSSDITATSVLNESMYFSGLDRSFGTTLIHSLFPESDIRQTTQITSPTKPWGE